MPEVRKHASASGRGRARHVVLERTLALLDDGLARRYGDAAQVLPDLGARNRLRHNLLLGRAHDNVRPRSEARSSVPRRLHPRARPRRKGTEDEQVARQRHRPAHDSQGLRRGRAAPHARGAHGAGARHIPLDRENFDLPPLHEQALEREPLCAHESRRRGSRSEDRRERASAPG